MFKCLSKKHVLMIGDSRTRFQYTTLATKLTHDEFPRCKEGSSNLQNEYCQAVTTLDGWTPFYIWSNQIFNAHDSTEKCYCYRDKNDLQRARENRFLSVSTPFGNITITYLQTYSNQTFLETTFPPLSNGEPSCISGYCNPSAPHRREVQFSAFSALSENYSKFVPTVTHAFVTTGWTQMDIGCSLKDFETQTKIKTWMISGPHPRGGRIIPQNPPTQGCNQRIFDRTSITKHLTPEFYVDLIHVATSVNEEYNHFMLDELCPEA
jgi:hypothetical protein